MTIPVRRFPQIVRFSAGSYRSSRDRSCNLERGGRVPPETAGIPRYLAKAVIDISVPLLSLPRAEPLGLWRVYHAARGAAPSPGAGAGALYIFGKPRASRTPT